MSQRVVKRARALRGLEDRSEHIWQHSPRAALRFLDEAEATFRRLAAMPGAGARYEHEHPALAELRFSPLPHFKNDLVFYRPIADGIEVLPVLHGARDIHGILAEEFDIEQDADDDGEGEGAE